MPAPDFPDAVEFVRTRIKKRSSFAWRSDVRTEPRRCRDPSRGDGKRRTRALSTSRIGAT